MDEAEVIDRVLAENPLIGFSFYTSGQVRTLNALAAELMSLLDSSMVPGSVDRQSFNRAYGLFWLWVLGAYEVTRTMCQAKTCFSPELATKLTELKGRLAILRIPFAKQEYKGERTPIRGEASVVGIDTLRKDFSFDVKGTVISVRHLINEFESVYGGITREDIVAGHSSAYAAS